MGIFDIFTTKYEQAKKEILSRKPNMLMHTSLEHPNKVYSFGPVYNEKLKKTVVFATDDEKLAILYALQPLYHFTFGQNDKCAIVTGQNHSLIKLDSVVAYIYYVDSNEFEPVVSEQGEFHNEWVSLTDAHIRSDMKVKKVKFKDVLQSGVQVFWVKDNDIVVEFDKQIRSSGYTNGNQMLDFLKDQSNWYPDKVVYMNAYLKTGLANQTESGWDVPKQNVTLEEITINQTPNIPQSNNFQGQNLNTIPKYSTQPQQKPPIYNNQISNRVQSPPNHQYNGYNNNFNNQVPPNNDGHGGYTKRRAN